MFLGVCMLALCPQFVANMVSKFCIIIHLSCTQRPEIQILLKRNRERKKDVYCVNCDSSGGMLSGIGFEVYVSWHQGH